jgi:hypothetical protein
MGIETLHLDCSISKASNLISPSVFQLWLRTGSIQHGDNYAVSTQALPYFVVYVCCLFLCSHVRFANEEIQKAGQVLGTNWTRHSYLCWIAVSMDKFPISAFLSEDASNT